jgi:uncharacterized membrane protein
MINILTCILVLAATLIGAFGILFIKKGSKEFNFNILKQLKNKNLMIGAILFVIGAIAYILALKMDELSIIYPLTSISYIWVSIISVKFLKEKMNTYKWIGIALIMLGIIVIATL